MAFSTKIGYTYMYIYIHGGQMMNTRIGQHEKCMHLKWCIVYRTSMIVKNGGEQIKIIYTVK